MRNAHPPTAVTRGQASFYGRLLKMLKRTRIPFRVGGTFALNQYLRLRRPTKDLDVFVKPSDFPRLLRACAEAGFRTEIEDERWIAKIFHGNQYCDVVFGSANMAAPVTSEWFKECHPAVIFNVRVKLLPPTEMIWSKVFILDRVKYDGNDVAHLILHTYDRIRWRRLLSYMDQHWEVLLVHLLLFRYIYPSQRHCVPRWLMDELLGRLGTQMKLPAPRTKVCRGRIFSRADYRIDVEEWGFADLVGEDAAMIAGDCDWNGRVKGLGR